MRSVAEEARANIAAANYHFGSKDAMVLEMLRERVQPINHRRLELLNQARNHNSVKHLSTYEIFHSLIFIPWGKRLLKMQNRDAVWLS